MRVEGPAAYISSSALRHNLLRSRACAPASRVMGVIKANAYGHDLAVVVPALADADALAVARVHEGVAVRRCGYTGRVVVLDGGFSAAELTLAAQHALDLVVHHQNQLGLLGDHRGNGEFNVWLKLDSGMGRLGFNPADFRPAMAKLERLDNVTRPIGLMTHLANADVRDDNMTEVQVTLFDELTAGAPGERSIANSAGLLAWPRSHADWVRPGIMLYGISPFGAQTGAEFDLRPAMRFSTRLIATKPISAGATVGYGATWRARTDTWIGTAAVGYGDGYPGNLPSGTPVLVNGKRLALAGRVSMDLITIDLGAQPAARVGDEVRLWGPDLPVEEIAQLSGRLAYELVCGVSRRVPRIGID